MIDPKKELGKWGPIDGKPIYMDPFNHAFKACPQFSGYSWPSLFGYFAGDRAMYVWDQDDMWRCGANFFNNLGKSKSDRKHAFEDWEKDAIAIKDMADRVNLGLENLSDQELLILYKKWEEIHLHFWLTGFLPEISNYGGDKILKDIVSEGYPSDYNEILEKLTTPDDLSFFQKEEREFLEICLIQDKDQKHKRFTRHQKEYYWLRNSYGFTQILPVEYFEREASKITLEEAKKKIEEIDKYSEKVKAGKQAVIKKFNIGKDIVDLCEKFAEYVWWQDYRKKFIFIGNHVITVFAQEIARRKNISFKEICNYGSRDILELLEKNIKINAEERFKGYIVSYHENGGFTFKTGTEANKYVEPFLNHNIDKNISTFHGTVVSKGDLTEGSVKILLSPRSLEKMKTGDILVAPMTSPDFIVAMRMASAIVTDEGGMMSHAAIVSRELGIPCIVGTKIATKILKDNDRVKIDTVNGKISILNKNE